MRLNKKIGLTILVFSLLITSAIIGGIFLLRANWYSLNIGQSIGSEIYVVSSTTSPAQMEQVVQLNEENMVSTQSLDAIYLDGFMQFLPMIILSICVVILLLTLALWVVLKSIYSKQLVAIINDLNDLDTLSVESSENKAITKVFDKLKNRFDHHLEDYKRLNSYLSHEQKNAIAILRANLELGQNEMNIQILDRLTNSIDDILTLSNQKEDSMNEVVDVSLICAEVCDNYRKIYPAIVFSFDEVDSTLILGKNRWIYRAVSNLVDNAIKYGEQKPIHISVKKQQEAIIVKIKDQGKGIDPAVHETIFNHNYRVNGLKQDGYGIGLSVVAHVCDLCKGFVYVESDQKEGSVFYLSFPSAISS